MPTWCFVDGVMFCEVGEPVLVVQVIRDGQHERAALLIDTPKEYAWPSREMYFPLTELEAAERHMQDYWPDSCRTRVGSMKVLVPEALDTDIERQEAERSIRYFIEHSGKVLRHVSKEASGFWYDARDFLKGKETSLPERDVDHLLGQVKEFLQRVDPAGNDFDDEERFILRFGRIFIERWEFRPLVVDNSLKN